MSLKSKIETAALAYAVIAGLLIALLSLYGTTSWESYTIAAALPYLLVYTIVRPNLTGYGGHALIILSTSATLLALVWKLLG